MTKKILGMGEGRRMTFRTMEITTAIGCRINCRHCPQGLLVRSYRSQRTLGSPEYLENTVHKKKDVMKLEDFTTFIEKIPKDIHISFSGMCEPWQNPQCTEMVSYAHRRGHKVHVYTTLMGMKFEDYFRLKAMDLAMFVVHVPDAEHNTDIVIDNAYLEFISKMISDAVEGSFHISRFSCHGAVHGKVRELVEASHIPVHNKLFDRAGNVTESCDIASGKKKRGRIICRWAHDRALDKNVLLPDGTVILCCMDYGLKFPLGNLFVDSFEEVSEGTSKQHYRQLLESDELGSILCRTCHRSTQIGSTL